MHTYSPFFETLYDQQEAVGSLGRGTHYSIIRATVFHDENGNAIPTNHYQNAKSNYHDFAVIWDEDHDYRVIKVIEAIYQDGLLPCFAFFGERKAGFTALMQTANEKIPQHIETSVRLCCDKAVSENYNDVWNTEIGTRSNPQALINANDDDVILYLNSINMLWSLGSKPISANTEI